MREEPQQVTTFCPRCGKPIIWSVRPVFGGEQLGVDAWFCYCPLSEDEWAELGNEAAFVLDDRGHAGAEREVRRVAEDPPP